MPVYTHLGTGQEAVGCGVTTLLRQDDYLIGTHRGVTEYVGKGLSVKDIFLEYGGRVDAISGGREEFCIYTVPYSIFYRC